MGFSGLQITVGTSNLFIILRILKRPTRSWSILGKLINSITLLLKNVLHISDGGLHLCFTDGGLQVLGSTKSGAAKNYWENLSWWFFNSYQIENISSFL